MKTWKVRFDAERKCVNLRKLQNWRVVERRLLLYIPFSTCRVCRVCRICRICREVCLLVHVEPTAAYRAYLRHDSTEQSVFILALVRTDLSDVIMDIQTRLDRIMQHTAVANPCHMENGVGSTAHHQRCTKFLVSLLYCDCRFTPTPTGSRKYWKNSAFIEQ